MTEEAKLKARICQRNWKLSHPEKVKQQHHRHHIKHRKECIANATKWNQAHREIINKRSKKYRKKWNDKNKKHIADYHRNKKYGLTPEQYDSMYLEQFGICALCHEPFGDQKPCVDHCHITNKVRGLIHMGCNSMIGYAKDNPETLELGAEYLKKHQGKF